MKTIIFISFFMMFLFSQSCKDILSKYDYRMKIKNNSLNDIFYNTSDTYPDTLVNCSNPFGDKSYLVSTGGEKVTRSGSSWEYIFSKELPSDTLIIFIFDSHALENTPWDTVTKNYMILKRYDLSYDDLVSMDWTITYP